MCQITTEASKRICSHMNEDHAVSVHAMVLSSLSSPCNSKITNCTLKCVSLTQMDFTFIECNGNSCMNRDLVIDFDPPLESSAQIRPRMVQLHQENLSPKFTWLITDPTSLIIIITVMALGLFTMMGYDAFTRDIMDRHASTFVKSSIVAIFGSTHGFFTSIVISFYFALFAHVLEALYAVHLCKKYLKLNFGVVLKWFMVVSMVGFPMTKIVLKFVSIHIESKNTKTKKN